MYVFGAIDHAAALARVGKLLGYRVTVCDARAAFVTPERFPEADELVVEWPDRFLRRGARRRRHRHLRAHARREVRRARADRGAGDARRLHRRDGQQGDDGRPRGAPARRGRRRRRASAASTLRSASRSAPARPRRSRSRSAPRSSRRPRSARRRAAGRHRRGLAPLGLERPRAPSPAPSLKPRSVARYLTVSDALHARRGVAGDGAEERVLALLQDRPQRRGLAGRSACASSCRRS